MSPFFGYVSNVEIDLFVCLPVKINQFQPFGKNVCLFLVINHVFKIELPQA